MKFEWITRHSSGATFEIAEMHPSPPLAKKASAVISSPDNRRNPPGNIVRRREGRARSPVASLSPMNCRDFARLERVASDNSRTARAGMSCRMMGSAVESAIARKCASMPACIGLL